MGVLQYFFLETHDKNHRKIKEFRAPGAKRVTHAPAQKTPRKYTFGKAYPSTKILTCKIFHLHIFARRKSIRGH